MTQLYINIYYKPDDQSFHVEGEVLQSYDEAKENLEQYDYAWRTQGFEYSHTIYQNLSLQSLTSITIEFEGK